MRRSFWKSWLAISALLSLVGSAGCRTPALPGTAPHAASPTAVADAAPAPTAASAPIRFTDITRTAGIDFRHQNSRTPMKYFVETMGSGCAFLDFDNDGWLDILLLNNAPLPKGQITGRPTMKLYRNNRDGTFQDVTRAAGLDKEMIYAMGVAVADYDNDGWQDIYVTCVLGPSRLFRNTGARTKSAGSVPAFEEVAEKAGVAHKGRWGTSCAWVDYDKDGWLDLFVCNYVAYRTLADDQPCFAGDQQRVYCIPSAYESVPCTLYRNLGNGRFRDVTEETGIGAAKGKALGVTVWDYNEDGWPDLFVANDTVPGFLFQNLGGKKFREVGVDVGVAYGYDGVPHSGMGIDAGDLNNDGKMWLAITNYQGQQTSLYQQTAPELFNDVNMNTSVGPETRKVLGFGVGFFDCDNDGFRDIFQVNGHVQDDIQQREPHVTYAQPSLLFRNLGQGRFEEVGLKSGPPFAQPIVGRGLAWGDIDNDGRVDTLITANNGPAMLWKNETPTNHHWLALRLIGTKSNRDGIGALARVTAGGQTQRALVRTGSSYLSQSDLRLHFGLGAAASADVEIRWPSGIVERFSGVSADRIWTAREGAGKLQ